MNQKNQREVDQVRSRITVKMFPYQYYQILEILFGFDYQQTEEFKSSKYIKVESPEFGHSLLIKNHNYEEPKKEKKEIKIIPKKQLLKNLILAMVEGRRTFEINDQIKEQNLPIRQYYKIIHSYEEITLGNMNEVLKKLLEIN